MRRFKSFLSLTMAVFLLVSTLLLAGCTHRVDLQKDGISVALYRYLPDLDYFQAVVENVWKERHPDIPLNFVEWDCYLNDNPGRVDVFMYDSICYSALLNKGYLGQIAEDEVEDIENFVPFTVNGIREDGKLYGIPTLACSYFLIYYKDDAPVAAVQSLDELYQILGKKPNPGQYPADTSYGLLMNFHDSYPYYYLDACIDASGEYNTFDKVPALDAPAGLNTLRQMEAMAGPDFAWGDAYGEDYDDFTNARTFNEGHGRAVIGYSEDMAFMQDITDKIDIKTISMASGDNIQLFYTDFVSVNRKVSKEKRAACLELANLISSSDALSTLLVKDGAPQYILPARTDLYLKMAEDYPLYNRLYELVMKENNRLFRFGKKYYYFISSAFSKLPKNMR